MLDVLSITSVIFLLVGLGRLVLWLGWFQAGDIRILGAYVANLALPALIFRTLAQADLAHVLQADYLAIYAGASLLTLGLGLVVSTRLLGLSPVEAAFQGLGMSCSNSGFIGLPIVLIALPVVAPLAFTHNVMVETLLMLPLILVLAERGRNRHLGGGALARQIARRLSASPILWAMLSGIGASLSGLSLPAGVAMPLSRSIDLLAQSSAAVSLVVIGASLANLSWRSIDARVLSVAVFKVGVMPALVVGLTGIAMAFGWLTMPADLLKAMIVLAGIAPVSIYPILSMAYGIDRGPAVALALCTALNFVTVTAALWLLGAGL